MSRNTIPLLSLSAAVVLLAGFTFGTASTRSAATASAKVDATPQGIVAELHSCELYTGGCTCSSESTLEGKYLLSVWEFQGGNVNGVSLQGLRSALLQKGSGNISSGAPANQAVLYVPDSATPAQRAALLTLARTHTTAPLSDRSVKSVPMKVNLAEDKVSVAIGNEVTLTAQMPPACDYNSCGESLWYQPAAATDSFVVNQVQTGDVVEPALSLRWSEGGRRTLFVGRFGNKGAIGNAICGTPKVQLTGL